MKALLYASVIVLFAVDLSCACSCYMARHQNSYCRADFAIKVNIASTTLYFADGRSEGLDDTSSMSSSSFSSDLGEYFNYTIELMDMYKTGDSFERADPNFLFSSAAHGMCGVQLSTGSIYYLTGYVRDGSLFVSSCSAISLFDELTEAQLAGITGMYAANCICRLNGQMLEPRWRRKRVCKADMWSVCEDRAAICKRVRGKKCRLQYIGNRNTCS